jgi:3-deoxy-D-manno-octulosonic-acid transferase
MFSLFYTIGIRFYYLSIRIASIWNPKAKKWIAGRKSIPYDIEKITSGSKEIIWFHCASVGEFEQGYPLLKMLRNEYPKYAFHITFFSPSGYDFVKQKYPTESLSFLPYDINADLYFFIRKIKPKAVILVKYEIWYRLIKLLNESAIPTFLISGFFRPDHFYFKWYGKPFIQSLKKLNHLFLQEEKSQTLLHSIGVDNTTVVGDTRFDRVIETCLLDFQDSVIENFIQKSPVFIAGSVWESDQVVLNKIIQSLPSDWKIILAPHEFAHYNTDWIQEKTDFYTKEKENNARILILDTMGLLSRIYRFASLTYVGGGFDKGLHNILEPAVYHKPILIGPNFSKFNEAVQLVKLKCVFVVENNEKTSILIQKLIYDIPFLDSIQTKLETFISANTNVSDKIAVYIRKNKIF